MGDRVQLTAPSPDLKLANRELGTVVGIGQDGRMSLKMDGGRGKRESEDIFHPSHACMETMFSCELRL